MRSWKLFLPLLASTLCLAQQPDRIAGPIDSSQMVALPGHVNRNAKPQYDQGPVGDSLQFGYVTLVIAPSPTQQATLDQLLAQQQDRFSAHYHKWLTPAQYADRFGLTPNDVNKITAWLKSQGLQILSVGGGRNSVIFSGTAAQIQSAFKTEIHGYEVNGQKYVANATPLQVPAALSGVVTSVRGLADFRPKPMYVRPVRGGKIPGPHPSYTTTVDGNTQYFLAPGDIATIYDINPLYNASPAIDGTGQKLAIIGQTDIYLADITDFRSGFGLNPITGCSTNATGIITACDSTYFQYVVVAGVTDLGTPSTCGDLPEADLDIEWSGAAARNAQIIFVNAPATFNSACTEITNNGGVNAALAYAINPPSGPPIAPVISMSYGLCEAEAESLETELEQGNAEGVTIMNSAGDSGAAGCDGSPPNNAVNPPFDPAVGGLAVNYPASSPEVTGVGGTSIPLADLTQPAASTYWGSNGANGGSALTTLEGQEIAWNDDVAFATGCEDGAFSATFCQTGGPPTVTGWVPITSAETAQEDLWLSIGGGGVSNCATETGVICDAGFPRPSWQAVTIPGLTSPQSTYRFVPDVSLLASPNFPGFIICMPVEYLSNTSPYDSETTSSCANGIPTAADGTISGNNFVIDPSIIGGTSASSPIFAGIVTLLNQYLGGTGLGNINPTLYSLAKSSPQGFHSTTSGENDVYCQAGSPSGEPIDVICPAGGVFGFSASNVDSTGGTGYNLVTGLGSVDADKLFAAWSATRTGTTTSISPSATNVNVGTSVTFTATVSPATATGTVSFYDNGSTTALGTATLASGSAAFSTTTLPPGSNSVAATYDGNATNNVSTSATPAVVTVTAPFTMTPVPSSRSVSAGQTATYAITITPVGSFTGAVSFTNSTASSPGSCTAGLPAGALCSFSQPGALPTTVTLTITTAANMALPSGAEAITVTGTSGGTAVTTTVNLTITATTESYNLTTTAATFLVTVGGKQTVNVTVNSSTGFIVGTGTGATTALPLTYTCLGVPSLPTAEIACQLPNNGQPTTATGVAITLGTMAPTSQLRRPLSGSPIFYALLLPGLFGVVFVAGSRTRGMRLLGLFVVLSFSTLWLGSCGGSGGGGTTTPPNPGTPPGTYTVTISATTGAPTGGTAITNSAPLLTITFNVSQ
jgi:hypothetical protein